MAPFSWQYWLTWLQEGCRQVGVPRREESAAAAAAVAAAAAAVAVAAAVRKNHSPWWQPQGAQPE